MRSICAVLLAGSLALGAELPVQHVVLYKHGVGYFERAGQLAAGDSVQLDFKVGEMNDVLKSLTLEVQNGAVAGLRYDSAEPLERKLGELPLRLGDRQPLSALLDQLKGARLELKFGADTIAGAIVSARALPAGKNRPEQEQVTLLLDSGEIRTLDLSAASSIRFPDAQLQAQLREYLILVTQARSTDKRSVYIDATESAQGNVTASYMLPMPVWKSSYRLIFGASGDPLLEGWAIVDNTTGDDWSNVRLALVSGRPISFISQLYEPRYVARQVADLPDNNAAVPQVYQGGVVGGVIGGIIGQDAQAAAEAVSERDEFAGRRMAANAPAPAPAFAKALRSDMRTNVAGIAAGRELGELFEYAFDKPVTVRAGQSAMLPFLQQKIGARKLLIFSESSGSENPLHSGELTNSTGKTLDGGPITVFDDNAYAGEALVETVKTGDKRLISYGVDLGTRITTQIDSAGDTIREAHFRRGVLTTSHLRRETKTYTIRNVDTDAKTLIIEQAIRPDFNLVTLKPAETTASAYRFEVALPASQTATFAVTEENVYQQAFAVTNLTPDVLASYVENRELPAAARQQLQRILDLKRQAAAAGNEIIRLEQEIAERSQDQQRLRQNISSLNSVAGQQEQVQRYAAQLAQQETELAGMRDRQAEARDRGAALETQLAMLIETMEF
jgi:hypothetical protein